MYTTKITLDEMNREIEKAKSNIRQANEGIGKVKFESSYITIPTINGGIVSLVIPYVDGEGRKEVYNIAIA